MSKNTNVELLATMEEIEEIKEIEKIKESDNINDPPLEINQTGDTNHQWNIIEGIELGDEDLS